MPSGKKVRGRKKRARKEAAHQRMQWEPIILRGNSVENASATSSCEHMLVAPPKIPQVGPTISFMNCLSGEGFFDRAMVFTGNPIQLCFQPLSRFPRVQEEESERSLAIDLLLRFIRNTFVHDAAIEGESWFHYRAQNEMVICTTIFVLELRRTYSEPTVVRQRAAKIWNRLGGGNHRDVLKFVAMRLPCTCLKKLHSAARKKVAKVGICWGCLNQFPRSQLLVCTGCMIATYCSRESQRADRSRHKVAEGCGPKVK